MRSDWIKDEATKKIGFQRICYSSIQMLWKESEDVSQIHPTNYGNEERSINEHQYILNREWRGDNNGLRKNYTRNIEVLQKEI